MSLYTAYINNSTTINSTEWHPDKLKLTLKKSDIYKVTFRLLNLEQQRESNSPLIMKVDVFIDEGDAMLVQFTSSFAVLLR